MAFENEKKRFQPEKNFRICAVRFTQDYFRENLAIHRFLGSDFKPLRLHLKEDAVPWTFFFFVRKRNHREECLPKHKDPTVRSAFAKRRKLEVCILHLSYST